MPGIPLTSLQDMLLLQQIQNQADPFRSGLSALAEGVSAGLEEARAKKLLKNKIEKHRKLLLSNNDNNATYKRVQELNEQTGELSSVIKPKSSTEKKFDIEQNFQRDVQSGLPASDLRVKYPLFSDKIDDLEIAQTVPKSRIIPQASVPTTSLEPQESSQVLVEGVDALGRVTKGVPETTLIRKGEIETKKQVETQKQKNILKAETDLRNATLKIDNTLDSFVDVAERTMELSGVGPGVLGGTLSSILGPTKINEFYNGFKGGLIEYASAIGRISIPGSRAARLVNIFKKTAPTVFDTIESAVQTSADSFRNGLVADMSNNPELYLFPDISDKEARAKYDSLSKVDQLALNKQLTEMLRDFETSYKEGVLRHIYNRNPNLLQEDTRLKIQADASAESSLIKSLGFNPDEYELVR